MSQAVGSEVAKRLHVKWGSLAHRISELCRSASCRVRSRLNGLSPFRRRLSSTLNAGTAALRLDIRNWAIRNWAGRSLRACSRAARRFSDLGALKDAVLLRVRILGRAARRCGDLGALKVLHGPRLMMRIGAAVAVRPHLWNTAVVQLCRFAPDRWWRRPPFLPVIDSKLLEFRCEAMYGNPCSQPPVEDVVVWLEWSRNQALSR